jgi:hypothetical protein
LASLEPLKSFLKRAPRHPVNITAWIRQTGSFATQPCRVIEISRTGVRLEVAKPYNVPGDFLLLFSKGGPGHHASVVWRRGTQVGAEFSSRLTTLALPS